MSLLYSLFHDAQSTTHQSVFVFILYIMYIINELEFYILFMAQLLYICWFIRVPQLSAHLTPIQVLVRIIEGIMLIRKLKFVTLPRHVTGFEGKPRWILGR